MLFKILVPINTVPKNIDLLMVIQFSVSVYVNVDKHKVVYERYRFLIVWLSLIIHN